MKKFYPFLFAFVAVFVISFLLVPQVFAQDVLGATDTSTQGFLPPTSSGPGLLLPDSPLYFLDHLKQFIRVNLAVTPDQKAKVYADIAGERLAEASIMLYRGNSILAEKVMQESSYNLQKAADELTIARLSGEKTTDLAMEITNNIKEKQDALHVLEDTSTGDVHQMAEVVDTAVLGAKIKVESSMTNLEKTNASRDDAQSMLYKQVTQAAALAKAIDEEISLLQKQASDSGKPLSSERIEMLMQAHTAAQNAQAAASKFYAAWKAGMQPEPKITPTPSSKLAPIRK